MTHQEIRRQLPDYVLGLLAPEQSDQIVEHLSGCATCRRVVHNEREIGRMVRQTLSVVTEPDTASLRQGMPAMPRSIRRSGLGVRWNARLAPALVVLLLMVGALLMWSPATQRPLPAVIPATATATTTNTPTATIAQGAAVPEDLRPADVIPNPGIPGPLRPSPAGAPTPAATDIYIASN